jgi:hypothetical protein
MNASTNIQRKSSRRRTSSVLVTFVAALFAAIGLLLIAVERTDAQTQGEVWAWGGNELGALGDGTNTDSNTPVQVSGLSGVQAIAAGGIHSLAIGSFKVKATKEPIRQSLLVDFDLDDEACSGDLIHLTGKLNAVFHLVDDGAGGFHVNTEFNFANVEGTGEPSGGHYTVPTTARSTLYSHSDGFPIIVTETTSSTVIGQGQLPDSTAHQVIHFTIHENDTVTAEVNHFRSECK